MKATLHTKVEIIQFHLVKLNQNYLNNLIYQNFSKS